MRLDQDFVRLLLAKIQEVQVDGEYHDIYFENRPDLILSSYIQLLNEAGLIAAADFSTEHLMCWRAQRITRDGERFLSIARNEKCWQKAKSLVRKSHRKVTLTHLKQALPKARKALLTKRRRTMQPSDGSATF